MALTQAEIDRILGKQYIVDNVLKSNQPKIKNTPRSTISGTWADILKPISNNVVSDLVGITDAQKALDSASYSQSPTVGGSFQTGGIRPEYLMGALALTPVGKSAKLAKKTEYEIAHELAQKNASLPVSEGGLGLPANNTAMDRAKAMGYTTPAYHGTLSNDVIKLNPYFYSAQNPKVANDFANPEFFGGKLEVFDNPNVIPLLINKGKTKKLSDKLGYDFDEDFTNSGNFTRFKNNGYTSSTWINEPKNDNYYLNYNPSDVRSINAAFDPFKRNEANILAGVGAVSIPSLLEEKRKK